MRFSRRAFMHLTAGSALSLAGGTVWAWNHEGTAALERLLVPIAVAGLPEAFAGYRIGFITDTHLGLYVETPLIEHAFNLVRAADIDLLLLGGDFAWIPDTPNRWSPRNQELARRPYHEVPERVYSTLGRLAAAAAPRDGVFGVLGNHDRWIAPPERLASFINSGFRLLVNEAITVQRGTDELVVIGVDDYWTGVPRLPDRSAPRGSQVRVLLAHNPDYVSERLARGEFDFHLAVCGHTHGGQIRLPLVGALVHNVRDTRFSAGLVEVGAGQVYTSRGVGVVEIPYRVNCPPEVTVFELTPAGPV